MVLDRELVDVGPVGWVVRTDDHGDSFTISGRHGRWTVRDGAIADPDVELSGTRRDLTGYLTTPPGARTADRLRVRLQGSEQEISRFLSAIAAFPPGRALLV